MRFIAQQRRGAKAAILGLTLLTVAGTASACGSSASSSSGSSGVFSVWDPYPQFDGSSAWAGLLKRCGASAGVSVRRSGFDTTDLTSKVLLAAQQGAAPDVLVVDNPVVSTLAKGGVLTDTGAAGLDTSGVKANLLAAGQVDGKTYGVPIGANTLALYYNKGILAAAGVDPSSIKDWASLNAALRRVKAIGKRGITFSAIGTEEGSFQFLPWFWGAGAQLTDLSSPAALSALSLWVSWLRAGYAPNSVIGDTQTTSWQEFAAGQTAFGENGTWQLGNAAKAGFAYGVIPIPSKDGGVAPAPTGGEFVTVPVQADASRYAVSAKIVACLTSAQNAWSTDGTLSYVGATDAVQRRQASIAGWGPWVDAVQSARGRTSGGLGTRYPRISQALWTAVQSALSGSASAQAALSSAQSAAAAAK